MAVRDAIVKAKQAHQQKQKKVASAVPSVSARQPIDYSNETSFDDISNPFNVTSGTPPLQAHLRRAIENGRTAGTSDLPPPADPGNLNISNLELQEIPEDVYAMYDLSSSSVVVDFSSKSSGWYESVDLQRFNASANEITEIHERLGIEFAAIKHFDVLPTRSKILTCRCMPITFLPCLPILSHLHFLEH